MNKRILTGLVYIFLINSIFSIAPTLAADNILVNKNHREYSLPYHPSAILVDAKLDEAVWQSALKISLNYETNPGENTLPPVTTEALLYENGKSIFVAFIAHDPNPELIKDYLTDRDNIWDSDMVGIKFDTFGESRIAYQFFVNALGVQADATQEDFKGDNSNWDAIWDSAGRVTKTGYIVEMEIPFNAIRFPESKQPQKWAFELLRFYPRDFRHRIANTPVDRNIACRICQFDKLTGLNNAKPSNNVRLIPTLVMGRTDSKENATSDWSKGDFNQELGLDLRWGITQDIYLNATINPDFSQVEADAAQLDVNNPFTIFVNEKRPFFLDGASYFETYNQTVHTRNIIAPDYGLKTTGQINGHSFGLFTVNDEHTSILLPSRLASLVDTQYDKKSENVVARYSYDLGNRNKIGLMHTDRSGDDYHNAMSSIDGKYWFDEYHYVDYQYMYSETRNPQYLIDNYANDSDYQDFSLSPNISGDAYTIDMGHESRNWWGYVRYVEFDKNFRADLGFISQVDYDKTTVGVGRRIHPTKPNSWWSLISFGTDWDHTFDSTGIKLEEEVEANLWVEGKLQSYLELGIGKRSRYWNARHYDETYQFMHAEFYPFAGLKLALGGDFGEKVDIANDGMGEETAFNPEVSWQINQNWLTSIDYYHYKFDRPEGNLFVARLNNFRVTYQFSIRSFLRFSLQKTDISANPELYIDNVDNTYKELSSQLLYSYKINPQTLFFAGYTDNGYQDDTIEQIKKTGRSVFMKFSYAWQS